MPLNSVQHKLKNILTSPSYNCLVVSIISRSAPPRRPIPVKELADHCARFHANSNALFNDEFKVRFPCGYVRIHLKVGYVFFVV